MYAPKLQSKTPSISRWAEEENYWTTDMDSVKDNAISDDETKETSAASDEIYVISNGEAYIRNEKLEKTEETIPKWTEVKIKESKTEKNVEYVFVTSTDGLKEYGWTTKSNLYSLSWSPKDKESSYKNISSAYNDQMQAVDPVENYKKLKLSGTDTKTNVDSLYPNQTDPSYLDSDFKTKYEKLKKAFEDNGITVTANAGLRHPLRSVIFNYSIKVRDASSIDIIQEANAVCRKYRIPIDWAHKNDKGEIDLEKSKSQAKLVANAFGISSLAARGVKDFGGNVSNHNIGKAVDLTLSFSFKGKKKITYNSKEFEVNADTESKGQTDKYLADIENSQLTLLGKEASGLNRSLPSDVVHWSEKGN